jgi:hypothetical protein
MRNILVHAARDFPVHFTTFRIHHRHSDFHPSVLSTSVAFSTFIQHPVNPWMTQIGPDLSPKCAYFTSLPKISTSVPPSIYLRGLGSVSSIQDPTSASSFRRLRIAPPVQPRYPHLFNFAIFSEFIAPLLPLVCSPSKFWSMYLCPLECCRLNHSATAALYVAPCHHLLNFANFDDVMSLCRGYWSWCFMALPGGL